MPAITSIICNRLNEMLIDVTTRLILGFVGVLEDHQNHAHEESRQSLLDKQTI